MNKTDITEIFEKYKIDSYDESWDISNVNKQMNDHDAIVHWVCRSENSGDLSILIELGADIDIKGDIGRTPLMEAVTFNQVENVKILLAAGADIRLQDDYGDTVYDLVSSDNKDMLELIKET